MKQEALDGSCLLSRSQWPAIDLVVEVVNAGIRYGICEAVPR